MDPKSDHCKLHCRSNIAFKIARNPPSWSPRQSKPTKPLQGGIENLLQTLQREPKAPQTAAEVWPSPTKLLQQGSQSHPNRCRGVAKTYKLLRKGSQNPASCCRGAAKAHQTAAQGYQKPCQTLQRGSQSPKPPQKGSQHPPNCCRGPSKAN